MKIELIQYAPDANGKLKHVSEVPNGQACNCFCPKCGTSLVAKNNPANKKIHHFAHGHNSACEGALETIIHLLAKEILQESKRLFTPDFHGDFNPRNPDSLFREGELILFDEVRLEEKFHIENEWFIPDAIGVVNGKQIFIEFARTHFIDETKKPKIQASNVACIEVDLSEVGQDKAEIENILHSNCIQKYWIANPKLEAKYQEAQRQAAKKRQLERDQQIDTENQRFEYYKRNSKYRVLKKYNSGFVYCPKRKIVQDELRETDFYKKDEVLRSIIDGKFWNGKIIGKRPNGSWIFIGKKGEQEKIIIYPPQFEFEQASRQKKGKCDFLFGGLIKIRKQLIKNSEIGNCGSCKFFVDNLYYDGQSYIACRFPKL